VNFCLKLGALSLLTSAYSQLRIVLKMLSGTKSGKFQMIIHIDYDREENKIALILASQGNVIRTLGLKMKTSLEITETLFLFWIP